MEEICAQEFRISNELNFYTCVILKYTICVFLCGSEYLQSSWKHAQCVIYGAKLNN